MSEDEKSTIEFDLSELNELDELEDKLQLLDDWISDAEYELDRDPEDYNDFVEIVTDEGEIKRRTINEIKDFFTLLKSQLKTQDRIPNFKIDLSVDLSNENKIKVDVFNKIKEKVSSTDFYDDKILQIADAVAKAIASPLGSDDTDPSERIGEFSDIIKEGPTEIGGKFELTAAQRFYRSNLLSIGSGVSRVTRELNKKAVMKEMIMQTIDHDEDPSSDIKPDYSDLAQHIAEGIDPSLPKKLEEGLDYVVVERVDVDKDKASVIIKEFDDQTHDKKIKLGTPPNKFGIVKTTIEQRNKIQSEVLANIDKQFGSEFSLTDKFETTGILDVMRSVNMGFTKEGVPKIIDAGSLSLGDPKKFLAENLEGGVPAAERLSNKIVMTKTLLNYRTEVLTRKFIQDTLTSQEDKEFNKLLDKHPDQLDFSGNELNMIRVDNDILFTSIGMKMLKFGDIEKIGETKPFNEEEFRLEDPLEGAPEGFEFKMSTTELMELKRSDIINPQELAKIINNKITMDLGSGFGDGIEDHAKSVINKYIKQYILMLLEVV